MLGLALIHRLILDTEALKPWPLNRKRQLFIKNTHIVKHCALPTAVKREGSLVIESTLRPGHDAYPEFLKTTSPGRRPSFDDYIIPTGHTYRTLVLCFDGTGDQFDDDNSNIVNFFSLLKKDDHQQLVYYQSGIGTYTIPQIAKPLGAKLKKTIDSMVGGHLDAHVMGGYEFLMQNYRAHDKIHIFGFSRGAYTARALAGMIHKAGLLPPWNQQQVPFAYKMYTREDEKGWKQSTAFKKAFSIDVDVDFLGVWDTVGSVGIIPRGLPFTTSNTHVKHFRHAISLDEHRARFKPNFWNRPTPEQANLGVKPGEMPRPKAHRGKSLKELERQYTDGENTTDVEEVWFAGCHCDVGGGAVKNDVRNSLARIPLRWMVRQCFILDTGILFHGELLKIIGMDPSSLWPVVKPRPPPLSPFSIAKSPVSSVGTDNTLTDLKRSVNEEEEEIRDTLSPINDMLRISPMWWILEVIPQKQRFQKDDDSWTRRLSINYGHERIIPKQKKQGVKMHRSVKVRMEADPSMVEGSEGKKYIPRAKWNVEPTWVD